MLGKKIILTCLVFGLCFTGLAQAQFEVNPPLSVELTGVAGTEVTIPLTLVNTGGVSIDAWGLKFNFPSTSLTYQSVGTAGTLTDGWLLVNGEVSGTDPNQLTIGGNNLTPTTSGGVLVNVIFEETGTVQAGNLQLREFVNDISSATTTDGLVNGTVPVEMVSFSAKLFESSVELAWATATETNNFGFDIERSVDNETFDKIGFISGNGTTVVPQKYVFEDELEGVASDVLYYRLRQIDTDGSFEYSSTLQVERTQPKAFSLNQNYPNPFNPETTISYRLEKAARVSLTIYNLKGQVVRNLINQTVDTGFHNVTWNGKDNFGRDVASGVYVYELKAGDVVDTKKLSLLR